MQNKTNEDNNSIKTNTQPNKQQISKWKKYILILSLVLFVVGSSIIGVAAFSWYMIPSASPYIANYIADKINLNVSIGSIETSWKNWKPRILIKNIKILDKKETDKIWFSASNIDLTFNKKNYGAFSFQPTFSIVKIKNSYLLVEQTKKGWIFLNKQPSGEPLESLPNWLFNQDRILLNNANIKAHALNKKDLNIFINAKLDKNKLITENSNNYIFSAQAKAEGIEVSIKALFSPNYKNPNFLGYFKEWKGSNVFYIKSDLDNQLLNKYKAFLTIDEKNPTKFLQKIKNINSINGVLAGNSEWKQTVIKKGTLNLNISNLDGKIDDKSVPLMKQITANIDLKSYEILDKVKDLGLIGDAFSKEQLEYLQSQNKSLEEQYIWKVNAITWKDHKDKQFLIKDLVISQPQHNIFPLTVNIKNTNLEPFINIANQGIIPAAYQNILKTTQPKALVNLFKISYLPNEKVPMLARFAIDSNIKNMQFKYIGKKDSKNPHAQTIEMLGKNGFNIQASGKLQNGQANIDAKNIAFNIPNTDKKILPLDSILTKLKWNIANISIIDITKIEAKNKDLNINAAAQYSFKAKQKGILNSSGNINITNINKIRPFLPNTLSKNFLEIIDSMDINAPIKNAKFKIAGQLDKLPFKDSKGTFLIDAALNNAQFNIPKTQTHQTAEHKYPDWHRFTNINGHFNLDKDKMTIKVNNAKSQNLNIAQTEVLITSLVDNPILNLKTKSNASLANMLEYVNTTPVQQWTSKLNFKAKGNAALALNLILPFKDTHNAKVNGTLDLQNNDIEFIDSLPPFYNTSGLVKFSEQGFSFNQAKANFLGEQVLADGYSKNKEIHIDANSILSKKGIEATKFNSGISRIPKYIEGSTPYNAHLSIINKQIKVAVNSDLKGMGILLPIPATKTIDEAKPLNFTWHLYNPEQNLERISIQYNKLIGALIEQKRVNGIAKNIRGIYYADEQIEEDIPLPDEGIQAKINLDSINADAWRTIYNEIQKEKPVEKLEKGEIKTQDTAVKEDAQEYLPGRVAAYTKSLKALDREIKDIILGLSREDDGWSGNISSSHINGYISIKPKSGKNINGLIEGHFTKLNIPNKEQTTSIKELIQEKTQDLPAINLKIDDFTALEKDLGKITVLAENEYKGTNRYWNIKKMTMENKAAVLNATGQWSFYSNKEADNTHTNIDVNLKLNNAGDLLTSLGAAQVLRKGNGELKAHLTWVGSPLEFNYPTLNSNISMDIKDGVIVKVDPAAAKLLGIISLQGLGNILTFNWNKIFAQGSPFDEIKSDAQIKNGILYTNNFSLVSAQAKVDVKGNVNLINETQNIQAEVYPKINAGSASVAYSLINPAIGIGTLLAQVAFSNPLSKILKQTFIVTGKWDKPIVKNGKDNNEKEGVNNKLLQER